MGSLCIKETTTNEMASEPSRKDMLLIMVAACNERQQKRETRRGKLVGGKGRRGGGRKQSTRLPDTEIDTTSGKTATHRKVYDAPMPMSRLGKDPSSKGE